MGRTLLFVSNHLRMPEWLLLALSAVPHALQRVTKGLC